MGHIGMEIHKHILNGNAEEKWKKFYREDEMRMHTFHKHDTNHLLFFRIRQHLFSPFLSQNERIPALENRKDNGV